MWGLASQQGSALWTLRNSTDAFGNVKEGAGYTTPPTPLFHNGGYTDPATGWTSPTDGGLAGDYDSGTGDALDEAALSGRNGLYAGMLGKASQIAGVGLDLGDFIASFNPIFNAGMVVTGQKASGRKGSAWDRIFAALSLIPGEAIAGMAGKIATPADAAKFGRINPQNIRFTQPVCSPNFSEGGHTLTSTVAALNAGLLPDKVGKPIRLVEFNGSLWSLDNRRLAAFKAANVSDIPVEYVSLSDPVIASQFRKRFNPIGGKVNGGKMIVISPSTYQSADKDLLRKLGLIR